MCLYIDEKITKSFLENHPVDEDRLVKVWKMLCVDKESQIVKSPFFGHIHWKPGWNKSNRKGLFNKKKLDASETVYKVVNRGIHVYIDKPHSLLINQSLIPVYARKKDLVACGTFDCGFGTSSTKEAVFVKVLIKKEDYDDILT